MGEVTSETIIEMASTEALEKCTKQHVQNATMSVKSHSNHREIDQCIVEIVTEKTKIF